MERLCTFFDSDAGMLILGIVTFAASLWSLCHGA